MKVARSQTIEGSRNLYMVTLGLGAPEQNKFEILDSMLENDKLKQIYHL